MKSLLPHLLFIVSGTAWAWVASTSPAPLQKKTPEQILPASAVTVFHCDGSEIHKSDLKQTAAWKAIEETGLRSRIFDLLQMFANAADVEAGSTGRAVIDHVYAHGASFAASTGPTPDQLAPFGVLVLHDAQPVMKRAEALIRRISREEGIELTTQEISGRKVTSVSPVPTMEIAWWEESGHLVVAFGVDAVNSVMSVVDGTV
ncbi:MAG: hypothetical protein KDA96_21155, partial [Planctomycetaceae bacterium]|nr:hypothetical protein [Planctomycetaceae bacterium]